MELTEDHARGAGPVSALVGRNVTRVREARGASQADLARFLGRSRSWMSKLEAGEAGITVDLLLLLAMALNTSPSWLLAPHNDEDLILVRVRGSGVEFNEEAMLAWLVGTGPIRFSTAYDFFRSAPPAARHHANAVLQAFEDANWISRRMIDGREGVTYHPGEGRPIRFPSPYAEPVIEEEDD